VTDLRVCFLGDSLVVGVGDPKALGWVGRVAARTPSATGVDLTAYALGVRGQSTVDVVVRVPLECAPRLARGDDRRVVLGCGSDDALRGEPVERSAGALAFGLGSVDLPTLVVGPPPLGDAAARDRARMLDAAFAGVCAERGARYVSTFAPLAGSPEWDADVAGRDHPGQVGYGLLAYVVLHGGWYDWLGLQPPDPAPSRRSRARPRASGTGTG
jgi:acyl-CoA thioesterase-1